MKNLLLSLLIIGLQLMFTGCELFEATKPLDVVKEVPCGSPDLGKDDVSKTMVEHDLGTTDLMIQQNGNAVKIGVVNVSNQCGYCQINIKLDECWDLMDAKVWIGEYGDVSTELKPILQGAASFPDMHVVPYGNRSYGITYPYQNGWLCDVDMYIAVWAKVKSTCDDKCVVTEANAVIGEWDLRSYNDANDNPGTLRGKVNVKVANGFLEVQYIITDNFYKYLYNAYLQIETQLSSIPNSSGQINQAKLDLFDYKKTGSYYNSSTKTFKIPLSVLKTNTGDYTCGSTWLYAVANATLSSDPSMIDPGNDKGNDNNIQCYYMEVWAGNNNGNQPNYDRFSTSPKTIPRYFKFQIPCGEKDCEFEGWGKGEANQEFQDNPLNLNKWGWYFDFTLLCN
jgi:hypothetical protein